MPSTQVSAKRLGNTFKIKYSELYHPCFPLICFIITKLLIFATVFGDILCIVISNRLRLKLQSIINYLEGQVQVNNVVSTTKRKPIADITSISVMTNSTLSWQIICNETREIRRLAIESSSLLSPVILNSLTVYLFILLSNVSF